MTAKKKKEKRKANGNGVTHAILFKYRGTKPKKKALLKKVDKHRDVVYYYLQEPMYYKLEGKTWVYYKVPKGQTPKFNPTDSVIFVFDDKSAKPVEHAAIGVAIDFQQGIGPFDDEVAAEVKMAAATRYRFRDRKGPRWTYALAWSLETHPPEGFSFESDGLYDYTVSVLTFNLPAKEKRKKKGKPPVELESRSLRFWRDPTMCVGGACSG